jgi:hypothetical protein
MTALKKSLAETSTASGEKKKRAPKLAKNVLLARQANAQRSFCIFELIARKPSLYRDQGRNPFSSLDSMYGNEFHSNTNWVGRVELCERRFEMIKKVAGGYRVMSEKGKNLGGPYKTKKEAEKRLQQVEYFKHNKS